MQPLARGPSPPVRSGVGVGQGTGVLVLPGGGPLTAALSVGPPRGPGPRRGLPGTGPARQRRWGGPRGQGAVRRRQERGPGPTPLPRVRRRRRQRHRLRRWRRRGRRRRGYRVQQRPGEGQGGGGGEGDEVVHHRRVRGRRQRGRGRRLGLRGRPLQVVVQVVERVVGVRRGAGGGVSPRRHPGEDVQAAPQGDGGQQGASAQQRLVGALEQTAQRAPLRSGGAGRGRPPALLRGRGVGHPEGVTLRQRQPQAFLQRGACRERPHGQGRSSV